MLAALSLYSYVRPSLVMQPFPRVLSTLFEVQSVLEQLEYITDIDQSSFILMCENNFVFKMVQN